MLFRRGRVLALGAVRPRAQSPEMVVLKPTNQLRTAGKRPNGQRPAGRYLFSAPRSAQPDALFLLFENVLLLNLGI